MDAPQLAYWGDFPVGVRQLEFVDANRPDYLDIDPETGAPVNEDRLIDALVWYPAIEDDQRASNAIYTRRFVQDPAWPMPDFPTEWQTSGAAITDAQPIAGTKFPVVLLIHGWGGNEVSLAYLGENLASKGYIAISPDLRDVEPDDPQVFELLFPRAMLNRAQDIRFIADEIEAKADEPDALLGAIANPDSFAIIANSLGGLGAVRVAGAGYQAASPGAGWVPGNLLGDQTEGAENSSEFLLPELDALVLIAPWGAQDGVSLFSDEALSRVDVPLMVIAGDQDSIAGYETGPRRIYRQSRSPEKYLLAFQNAGHAMTPGVFPPEADDYAYGATATRDPVWRSEAIAMVQQHFVSGFLDAVIRNDQDARRLIQPGVSLSNDGIWPDSQDNKPGTFAEAGTADASYWPGFQRGRARGLQLEFEFNEPSQLFE